MAGVFLSYDRDDTGRARHFARALEQAGHEVWWDLHVRGGAEFSRVIEEALKSAKAVVVLWSANSIESPWVRDEAAAGRDTGRLIPVTIDGTLPPLGFRQFQTIDLSGWNGRGKPVGLRSLLADVAATEGTPPPPPPSAPSGTADTPSLPARPFKMPRAMGVSAALATILLFAGGYWWMSGGHDGPPTVALTAADASPQSQSMARDLLVRLGNLQSARTGSVTLVNASGNSRAPDLVFQTSDTGNSASPSATLALLDGNDGGLLWSNDFEQPAGSASDLKQQVAFTGGRVLDCALDGLSHENGRLETRILKVYLNACAQLPDTTGDPRPVLSMLRQVTEEAPHFSPGWAKLLIAQAWISSLSFTNGMPDQAARSDLKRFIDQARKLHPGIAEADLAETVLLPPDAYSRQLELIDRAASNSPDNPQVMTYRASALMNVGRMSEAIDAAGRAAQIDPLSPALSAGYMAALLFGGLIDPGRRQLEEIEKLWPGSAVADNARWLFYFRYGDPKVALGMAQTGRGTAGVPYLIQARIDPSAANVDRLVAFLRARRDKLADSAGANRLSYYALAMGSFRKHDELFETLMRWEKRDDLALLEGAYFRPELREFRKEPRFLQVMKRAGLLDYWRTSGKWPDFCFDADMPYDCRAEAAKLT